VDLLEEAAMSNYLETDFCTQDQGLDYIFGRMMAIFGAPFNRHFDGLDPEFVRQEWKNQLDKFLTYRPSMDFAIAKLDGEFIPSAIKFRNLCNAGPDIPVKPLVQIERKKTLHEQIQADKARAEGLAKLAELRKAFTK
jgi:hypothetical protein